MIGYVGNTDHRWFDFLLQRRDLREEINFWFPSPAPVSIAPGSLFFFRLKAPRNVIGGYGVFSRFFVLPEWLAWETLGQANGAATLAEFQMALRRNRDARRRQGEDGLQQIGCMVLAQPVFFPPEQWITQPSDWRKPIVRYASYDLTKGEGLRIFLESRERESVENSLASESLVDRYGQAHLVAPRLGQGTFRLAVTEAYGRACAVTQEHSLPALEAAHVKPFAQNGPHIVNNGLLLRSDLHRLFDRGYVTVTPEYRLEVSSQLRNHFQNGKTYYPLHGRRIELPARANERPEVSLLRWHNEKVYLG